MEFPPTELAFPVLTETGPWRLKIQTHGTPQYLHHAEPRTRQGQGSLYLASALSRAPTKGPLPASASKKLHSGFCTQALPLRRHRRLC